MQEIPRNSKTGGMSATGWQWVGGLGLSFRSVTPLISNSNKKNSLKISVLSVLDFLAHFFEQVSIQQHQFNVKCVMVKSDSLQCDRHKIELQS